MFVKGLGVRFFRFSWVMVDGGLEIYIESNCMVWWDEAVGLGSWVMVYIRV